MGRGEGVKKRGVEKEGKAREKTLAKVVIGVFGVFGASFFSPLRGMAEKFK